MNRSKFQEDEAAKEVVLNHSELIKGERLRFRFVIGKVYLIVGEHDQLDGD